MNRWKDTYDLPTVAEARRKIREAFGELEFVGDGHRYFLGERELECVSSVVGRWSSADEEAMMESALRREWRLATENPAHTAKTREEIEAEWNEASRSACEFGTACHAFGEGMFWWMTGQEDRIPEEARGKFGTDGPAMDLLSDEEKGIVEFWNDIPDCYIPVLAEAKVFNTKEAHAYAGTFDLLFYYNCPEDASKSGFAIFDYKTNKALESSFVKKRIESGRTRDEDFMKEPFRNLIEEPQSHYALQLGLYQMALENIGIRIAGRRLIWVGSGEKRNPAVPDGKNYELRRLKDITATLREALKDLPESKGHKTEDRI